MFMQDQQFSHSTNQFTHPNPTQFSHPINQYPPHPNAQFSRTSTPPSAHPSHSTLHSHSTSQGSIKPPTPLHMSEPRRHNSGPIQGGPNTALSPRSFTEHTEYPPAHYPVQPPLTPDRFPPTTYPPAPVQINSVKPTTPTSHLSMPSQHVTPGPSLSVPSSLPTPISAPASTPKHISARASVHPMHNGNGKHEDYFVPDDDHDDPEES